MLKQAQRGILPRLPLLAAAALLALSACTGDLTSPGARAAAARADQSSGGGKLIPSSVKYNDKGVPHATGRSGSARLEGMARLGADGVTRVTITTGSLDDPTRAPGQIVKAQLKVMDASGAVVGVRNYNGLAAGGTQSFLLPGLQRGFRVQVQANVRGIDRNRTDVVTLTAPVALAPALEVAVQLPPTVTVGQPVVITGVVSETNGDAGTRATCELWVNGQRVDQAAGIWVDAGDAVTCAFTYTFPSTGEQQVEVRVNGADGGAAQPVLLSAGGTVPVVSASGWSGQVEDRTVVNTQVMRSNWWKPDGSTRSYQKTEENGTRGQSMGMQGTLSRAVVFPLASVDLDVESNGYTWHSERWTALAAAPDAQGRPCATRDVPTQGAVFYVCNGAQGGASWGYQRFAGIVTYRSVGFVNQFDGVSGATTGYTWNEGYTAYGSGGQVRDLGAGVTLRLTVTDAEGGMTATPVVPVAPFSGNVGTTPETCNVTNDWWLDGGQQTICIRGSVDESGWRGRASG